MLPEPQHSAPEVAWQRRCKACATVVEGFAQGRHSCLHQWVPFGKAGESFQPQGASSGLLKSGMFEPGCTVRGSITVSSKSLLVASWEVPPLRCRDLRPASLLSRKVQLPLASSAAFGPAGPLCRKGLRDEGHEGGFGLGGSPYAVHEGQECGELMKQIPDDLHLCASRHFLVFSNFGLNIHPPPSRRIDAKCLNYNASLCTSRPWAPAGQAESGAELAVYCTKGAEETQTTTQSHVGNWYMSVR